MVNNQSELKFENKRLEQTISLAKNQLSQAIHDNEESKLAIISAKRKPVPYYNFVAILMD